MRLLGKSLALLALLSVGAATAATGVGGSGLSGGGGGGSGTVTNAGLTITGGILSVAGSPITTSGTFALTIAGTSGGIPYFSSSTGWASSAALAANSIVLGGGAGAAPVTTTTGSGVVAALGNATNAASGLPTQNGAITTGNCLKWGPGVQDAGVTCGTTPPLTITAATATLTGASGYAICSAACTITLPAPTAGAQFCIINGDNVSSAITLAALGGSARYETTARTSYGTAGTGTMVSGGAVNDKVCLIGIDATHYIVGSFNGTWTNS